MEGNIMERYIEVAQTQYRYLSSRDSKKIIIHRIETGLLQLWKIEDSDEQPYKYIKSVQNEKLVIISPNERDAQIRLVPFDGLRNRDLAKWKLVPVSLKYGNNYNGANEHNECVFIIAKLIPLVLSQRLRKKEHEMGSKDEVTHNNTLVILWNHQGVDVKEPRNQMWILREQPR
jgi:hypothetical protein